MMNYNQVKELFDRECILIGSKDVVPTYKAVKLFGKAAIDFSERLGEGGLHSSFYGIGDYNLRYLTFKGFQVAATYQNIDEIRKAGITKP